MQNRFLFLFLEVLMLCVLVVAQNAHIYFPDIEQGACTIIVSPSGQAAVIDGGTDLHSTDEDIISFLKGLKESGVISSIDYVIATHYDEDHIGKLDTLLESGLVSKNCIVYDRGDFFHVPSTSAYNDFEAAAAMFDHKTMTVNTILDLGSEATLTCKCVNGNLPNGGHVNIESSDEFENSASIGMVFKYKDFDLWVGGDLTGRSEYGVADVESQVAPFVGDVDVLLLDHHGSIACSNTNFLHILKAEVGIAQMGTYNNYGHPNKIVVSDFLNSPTTSGSKPIFIQTNPGNPLDSRSDDSLADYIVDPDDVTTNTGKPGTISLITDGNSYQISGGTIAPPITLVTDSGNVLSDFPPSILNIRRFPTVPSSEETLIVKTDVYDDNGINQVLLHYSINGIEQTPIEMSIEKSNTFNGIIPQQPNGTEIKYWISAVDNIGQTTNSAGYYLFWGVTPISRIRSFINSDGILTDVGYWVKIRGSLSVEPEIFSPIDTLLYVQDSTGGIKVFKYGTDRIAGNRYDTVQITGIISQFNGEAFIDLSYPGASYYNYGAGCSINPQIVTISELNSHPESFEGNLVTIKNVSISNGQINQDGNSFLTITDDSGNSTITLMIDGDTNIPGSNMPDNPFSITGLIGQYDFSKPFNSYYQVKPRDRNDFDPPLIGKQTIASGMIINEILASPQDSKEPDVNGDGHADANEDEFIELVNNSNIYQSLGGWTICDSTTLRHRFPAGVIVPPHMALVLFGGGTPQGTFGNCQSLGLVFTATSGSLGLNDGGDTVTLLDNEGNVIDSVSYGEEASHGASINRDPDVTGTIFSLHSSIAENIGQYSPGTKVDGTLFSKKRTLILTEIFYNAPGTDDGKEWIELYNNTTNPINLSNYSIGYGGSNYTYATVQLNGIIKPFSTFVIGGPESSNDNGNPIYNLKMNFTPDIQNGGTVADGVALFNCPADQISSSKIPMDAVIYGSNNSNNLIDETGSIPSPMIGNAHAGASIERISLEPSWQIQYHPGPGTFPSSGWHFEKGDVNFDGQITVTDLLILDNVLLGNINLTNYLFYTCDLNSDSNCNSIDSVVLANVIAGNL